MWLAKDWCIHKPWILLPCGHSCCYLVSFCSAHWRNGRCLQFFLESLSSPLLLLFAVALIVLTVPLWINHLGPMVGDNLCIDCTSTLSIHHYHTHKLGTGSKHSVLPFGNLLVLTSFPLLFCLFTSILAFPLAISFLLSQAKKARERVYDYIIPVESVPWKH